MSEVKKKNVVKRRRRDGLLFKFGVYYSIFVVIMLIICGIGTYVSQMRDYKEECETNIKNVGEYLGLLMKSEGFDIGQYQEYYMNHYEELRIPYDFDSYEEAFYEYQRILSEEYPGKMVGVDFELADASEELQRAYFTYTHEYWILTFEEAREAFDLPYTYYLVMDDPRGRKTDYDNYNVTYMIDGERTEDEDHPGYLFLGDTYHNDREKYDIMWKTWEQRAPQNGFMEWDNSWGHTYGYYLPLTVDDETYGLIVTEIDYKTVNRGIIVNTIRYLGIMAIVLLAGMFVLGSAMGRMLIKPIGELEREVVYYSDTKDVSVASVLEKLFQEKDEISKLGQKFAEAINELDKYMKDLAQTTEELDYSKKQARALSDLANKDSLTGVRNKTAFDGEIERIKLDLLAGYDEFGLVMVDLNYLKKINDTYGHEKGNIAIKKMCHVVCVIFAHSPVFRIGGDEFIVVLRNNDYKHVTELIAALNKEFDDMAADPTLQEWEKTSAAVGYALFDKSIDEGYEDVFKRADEAMYERKKEQHAIRED